MQDGTTYLGVPFGSVRPAAGEVVFNTGMVGYPESLTDPSYRGQILVLNYPLIGNYGVPHDERRDGLSTTFESDRIQVAGLVVSQHSVNYSHFLGRCSLDTWLKEQNIPGLSGV